ncbi:MAG: translocation/assembly module TamB domain-containing protein [Bdellovibrionota bacterium]
MRKTLKIVLLSLAVFLVLLFGCTFFVLRYPQTYFKQEWVIKFLKKQDFAKEWKWTKLEIDLTSPSFLTYLVTLNADDLNASYDSESMLYKTEDADIALRVRMSYSFKKGLKFLPLSPLRMRAKNLLLVVKPSKDETPAQHSKPFRWKEMLQEIHELSLPDLNVNFDRILLQEALVTGKLETLAEFSKLRASYDAPKLTLATVVDLQQKDSPPMAVKLEWDSDQLVVTASTPRLSVLRGLACEARIEKLAAIEEPSPLGLHCSTELRSPILFSKIRIPALPLTLDLKAQAEHDLGDPAFRHVSFTLESPNPSWTFAAKFAHSQVSLDKISLEPARAIEEMLPDLHADLKIPRLKKFLKTFPPGYNEAPAPISAMDGKIELGLHSSVENKQLISKLEFLTALEGAKQEIRLRAGAELPWDTSDKRHPKPGALKVSVLIDKFLLMLPRVSIREPLPALIGDSRIKHGPEKLVPSKPDEKPFDWSLSLKTKDPVSFSTSLLKEDFRFLFDLMLGPAGPEKGRVTLLPMKAEILRRPIEVQNFVMDWKDGDEATLKGSIRFPLPEYVIVMKIEGPVSSPRTAFESNPPLSTQDIYSVLLFGRPLSELDPEGRQGISRVQQGLAQGFFSLSTLYLLAGSRIESLGYDPTTNDVSAQLRLDKRHTIRVGSQAGQGSIALRRSLGGGWFIESSAQEPKAAGEQSTNFGLLLQRIIAY